MWGAKIIADSCFYHCLDPDCDVYGKAPLGEPTCWACGGTNLKMNVSVPGWTAHHRHDPTKKRERIEGVEVAVGGELTRLV